MLCRDRRLLQLTQPSTVDWLILQTKQIGGLTSEGKSKGLFPLIYPTNATFPIEKPTFSQLSRFGHEFR